jgi:hypothetical protein
VTKLTTLLLGVSLTLLPRAGCAVGPNYIETRVDVPDMYRGTIPGEEFVPASSTVKRGNEKLW